METVPLAGGWRGDQGRSQDKERLQPRPEAVEPWSAVDKFMALLVVLFILGGLGVTIGSIVTAAAAPKAPPPSQPSPLLPPPSPPAAANSLFEVLFSVGGAPVTVGVAGATVDVRLQRSETGLSNQEMELKNVNADASEIATSGCTLVPNSLTNAVQDPASVAVENGFLKAFTNEGGVRTSLTHAIRFQVQLDGAASVCEVTLLGSSFLWSSGGVDIANAAKTFALPMSGDSDER
tara:strand:+ start:86 stop:790 length:705 start_codon:yes stop_codon:yes gene_type:complete